MSDIPRYVLKHGDFGGISQEQGSAGPYVRWDDHQAEVERLKADIARLVQENRQDVNHERKLATSAIHRSVTERDEAQRKAEQLQVVVDGERSLRDMLRADKEAAITLLTTQRDEAQAEVTRLKAELKENDGVIAVWRRRTTDTEAELQRLTEERDNNWDEVQRLKDENARRITECGEAWVEVTRLRQQERQLEDRERVLAQGDIWRQAIERNEAQREVERLKAENATFERANAELNVEVARLSACRDELRFVTEAMNDPAINNTVSLVDAVRALTTERDEAQAEMRKAIRERNFAREEVERLTDAGNHSESLKRLRPTDEDIWREAFFRAWEEKNPTQLADWMLTEYRKRWPTLFGPMSAREVTETVTLGAQNREDTP